MRQVRLSQGGLGRGARAHGAYGQLVKLMHLTLACRICCSSARGHLAQCTVTHIPGPMSGTVTAGLIWNAILSLENSTKGRIATQPAAGKDVQRGSGAKR